MSSAGNLGFLRGAIFAQLDRKPQPLCLPVDHPERPWLEWLGVPLSTGALPGDLKMEPLAGQALALKEEGILPEVVYSCLVQTWWHPGQDSLVARTRSEILACFDPAQLDLPGWDFVLEEVRRVNAYRLQELTPAELLEASRPFWGGECQQVEAMEAWILLNLENFQKLGDVADCLSVFWDSGSDRGVLPAGVDWEQAAQILGPERVGRLRIN